MNWRNWRTSGRIAGLMVLGALVATAQTRPVARPGSVNYVEGLVTLNGQPVDRNAIGSREMAAGQVLATTDGKAEVLLTPGVFLRLDSNSAVRMVSPDLADTVVELMNGRAMVEADFVAKENHIEIDTKGSQVVLEKNGLYEVNADKATVSTFDGKATVIVDERHVDVGRGRVLALVNNPKWRTQGFDRNATDSLYAWSRLRSHYMAQASAESARMVLVGGPYRYGYGGAGWFWNPWYSGWAFLPGTGYLYSPFGFAFYSPLYWGGYGYGLGYGAFRGGYGGFGGGFRGGGRR
ncbi:MAG: FecR domain-containing protein [Bryobacteraceae bacterium]